MNEYIEFEFEPPLSELLKHFETYCVTGCCGYEAFEFSASNAARYLRTSKGPSVVAHIMAQLEASAKLLDGKPDAYLDIDSMNLVLSAEDMQELTADIKNAFERAAVMKASEERRLNSK